MASRANTTTEAEFIPTYSARVMILNDAQSAQYHADVLIIITILGHKTQDTLRRIIQRFMSHSEQAEQLTEAQITTAEVKLAKLKQLLIRVAGTSYTGRYFIYYIVIDFPRPSASTAHI